MSTTPGFICLAGASGAGKDTLGGMLVREHGFQRIAFADPLKMAMMLLFQLGPEQLWGEERNVPDARLGRAPRELYQRFGQACVEVDPEVWIRPFRAKVESLRRQGGRVVCTDLRTPAEWETARQLGARLWLIVRPGAGAPGAMGQHPTERGVAAFGTERFDHVLQNDGSLEELRERLGRALSAPG
jgi:hypothetical protein